MRHASYHATGRFASGSSSGNRTSKRRSLFAVLLEALHRSQMQRVLRHYDHLIERAKAREAVELKKACKLQEAFELKKALELKKAFELKKALKKACKLEPGSGSRDNVGK